jgi:hypothetical protein
MVQAQPVPGEEVAAAETQSMVIWWAVQQFKQLLLPLRLLMVMPWLLHF